MTYFDTAAHPRAGDGRFETKDQRPPELSLDRPYSADQERLAGHGFPVSHDDALIETYSVEPGIWLQSVSPPDLMIADLSAEQRSTVVTAAQILDGRRGRPAAGSSAPWHRADCYAEEHEGVAVYIRSRSEDWTEEAPTLRILLDAVGGVVDARQSEKSPQGGFVWTEL